MNQAMFFSPPLSITRDEVDFVVGQTEKVVSQLEDGAGLGTGGLGPRTEGGHYGLLGASPKNRQGDRVARVERVKVVDHLRDGRHPAPRRRR